ncbi:hypothetical protein [Aminobacter carboxidus]|uniref:Uncharacterized protein n=1 Tax=Aminobacter carboxidus TaxID=376165 RepID=A0ABR9GQH3_9HYPH|nr:hypothetical protein [Aminobacter carboxidus]MBE1205934.1 hypothetical protein [Aminobacter carboxidus]
MRLLELSENGPIALRGMMEQAFQLQKVRKAASEDHGKQSSITAFRSIPHDLVVVHAGTGKACLEFLA